MLCARAAAPSSLRRSVPSRTAFALLYVRASAFAVGARTDHAHDSQATVAEVSQATVTGDSQATVTGDSQATVADVAEDSQVTVADVAAEDWRQRPRTRRRQCPTSLPRTRKRRWPRTRRRKREVSPPRTHWTRT